MNYSEVKEFIEDKCQGGEPLYIVIRGSHAYGTNIEGSDLDMAGVYIQSMDDILSGKYKPQINDDKNDTVFYELRRFLELVESNNPNILELLNTPEDCIVFKHPLFDQILERKNEFITKICGKSFGGYAIAQISKAKGLDKKQNWEKDRIERKTPIDFCYLQTTKGTLPLTKYLNDRGLDQSEFGLSKANNGRDLFLLFRDKSRKYKLKGISFEDSNDVRYSSIPKELVAPNRKNKKKSGFVGFISYNKDGYVAHCNDYKSYQVWLKERNTQRYVDVKEHGQQIDGKNLMHCVRLLDMAKEIGSGQGINVRRPNAEYLISIRKGKVDLQELLDYSNSSIKQMDSIFKDSNLPDSVDPNLVSELTLSIRKQYYFNK